MSSTIRVHPEWVKDPVPPFIIDQRWWELLTVEQQKIVSAKQIDQKIVEIDFAMKSLAAQTEILKTMQSFVKTQGTKTQGK